MDVTLKGEHYEATDEQLAQIEAILKEEPPELEEGDYGIDCRPESMVRVIIRGEAHRRGGHFSAGEEYRCNFTKYGNIFDDLEQYTKDADNVPNRIHCKHQSDWAEVEVQNGYVYVGAGDLCPDCAIKYAHAIIQAACTVKRKKG